MFVLAVSFGCGGCKSTNTFVLNPDQSVSVNVTDMPIASFIDLVNETYEHSRTKTYPLVIFQPGWHPRNRKTNINSEPLISLHLHQTSTSNVIDILLDQYPDVVRGVASAFKLDPARVSLSQGGSYLVKWKDLPSLEGMDMISQVAELLKNALGNSANVKIEVSPRQLETCSSLTLTDDLSPMTVNDFVQLIEFSLPVIIDFTDEGVVIRFDETDSNKKPFSTRPNNPLGKSEGASRNGTE